MRRPMAKLLSIVKPYIGYLVIAAIMAMLGAAADQAVPLQVKRVINEASKQASPNGPACDRDHVPGLPADGRTTPETRAAFVH